MVMSVGTSASPSTEKANHEFSQAHLRFRRIGSVYPALITDAPSTSAIASEMLPSTGQNMLTKQMTKVVPDV